MNQRLIAILALVPIALSLGCNRGAESTNSSPGATTGGSAAGSSSNGQPKLKIVFIPKNTGNPYFDEVDRGFQEAAKELGADYSTSAPATADQTSQLPIIKAQIQNGVDVIAISSNSPDALNPVLDQARSRGITIITVDSDLVGNESHRDAAVLPADFAQIGPSQIELMGSLIGYSGDIAILSATADAPNQNAWIGRMQFTLAMPKYSKMHLVDTVYGDDEPQKSTTECEGLLAKHPGLRGIIAPTSVGLAAGAQVIERAGVYPGGAHAVGPGLELTGLSTPNQLKKFVTNGVVKSFELWSPANEGYLAAYLGAQIHTKKLTPAPGGIMESPKFGKQTFSKKLEIIAGPLVTFDKTNIDKYNF